MCELRPASVFQIQQRVVIYKRVGWVTRQNHFRPDAPHLATMQTRITSSRWVDDMVINTAILLARLRSHAINAAPFSHYEQYERDDYPHALSVTQCIGRRKSDRQ
jgi:hypothetical protein